MAKTIKTMAEIFSLRDLSLHPAFIILLHACSPAVLLICLSYFLVHIIDELFSFVTEYPVKKEISGASGKL